MKKLLILAAVLGTSAAFADDQNLQNRLATARCQDSDAHRSATVAVYSNEQGIGRNDSPAQSPEARFELRSNGHGQVYGAYVAND